MLSCLTYKYHTLTSQCASFPVINRVHWLTECVLWCGVFHHCSPSVGGNWSGSLALHTARKYDSFYWFDSFEHPYKVSGLWFIRFSRQSSIQKYEFRELFDELLHIILSTKGANMIACRIRNVFLFEINLQTSKQTNKKQTTPPPRLCLRVDSLQRVVQKEGKRFIPDFFIAALSKIQLIWTPA